MAITFIALVCYQPASQVLPLLPHLPFICRAASEILRSLRSLLVQTCTLNSGTERSDVTQLARVIRGASSVILVFCGTSPLPVRQTHSK